MILYADDILLTTVAENWDDAEIKLNEDLNEIMQWCKCSQLTINTLKTKYILFKAHETQSLNIRIQNLPVEKVDHYCYLGVTLESSRGNCLQLPEHSSEFPVIYLNI